MAFKMSKTDEKLLEGFKTKVDEAFHELEEAISKYNETLNSNKDTVQGALNHYNEALGELHLFVEEFAQNQRNEYDEKSDTWKEGDTGSTVDEWISTWEDADFEDGELSFPDELELEFDNHSEIDLPIEPE